MGSRPPCRLANLPIIGSQVTDDVMHESVGVGGIGMGVGVFEVIGQSLRLE